MEDPRIVQWPSSTLGSLVRNEELQSAAHERDANIIAPPNELERSPTRTQWEHRLRFETPTNNNLDVTIEQSEIGDILEMIPVWVVQHTFAQNVPDADWFRALFWANEDFEDSDEEDGHPPGEVVHNMNYSAWLHITSYADEERNGLSQLTQSADVVGRTFGGYGDIESRDEAPRFTTFGVANISNSSAPEGGADALSRWFRSFVIL